MAPQLTRPEPIPTVHHSEVWVLKAVFGASLAALAVFWAMMLAKLPQNSHELEIRRCQGHQEEVAQALRELSGREGAGFAALLKRHGKGATLGPLFPLLARHQLLEDPPPHTSECRSWKDYTIVDPQRLELAALSCRVHGGRVPKKGAP